MPMLSPNSASADSVAGAALASRAPICAADSNSLAVLRVIVSSYSVSLTVGECVFSS